jgi:hypothetical protein
LLLLRLQLLLNLAIFAARWTWLWKDGDSWPGGEAQIFQFLNARK